MTMVIGPILICLSGVLFWIALPKNGVKAAFLKGDMIEAGYSLLIIFSAGMGAALVLSKALS